MNRILSSLVMGALFMSTFAMGQVVFSENFDSSNQFPAGWATFRGENGLGTQQDWRINTQAGYSPPNSAFVQYENVPGVEPAEDWMVTPLIDLTGLASPALTFMTAQLYAPDYGSIYQVRVSTASQTNHNDFAIVAQWNETQLGNVGVWGQKGVSLADYAGQQIYIAFVMVQDDGDNWYVDNVEVQNVESGGATLASINMNALNAPGNIPVSATLLNTGTTTITSFTAAYYVDGSFVASQEYTGVNIPFTSTYNFDFTQQYDAAPGAHTVQVVITHVNGVELETPISLDSTFAVATGSTERLALIEHFTSSTCDPCFNYNTNVFNPSFMNSYGDRFALIRYQMNWPIAGDPYYTAEGGVRRNYYGVNAVPELYVDSRAHSLGTANSLLTTINNANNIPGYVAIDATHTINGNEITVNTQLTPFIDGEYTVHVVVFENETTGNVRSNGETRFEHVMMKMMPNAQGTTVTFADGQPYSFSLTQDLSSTNIEEMDDLGVVVFVQHNAQRTILNSGYSEETLSTSDVAVASRVSFAPNPAKDVIQINTPESVNVQIVDVTGKIVKTQKNVQNNAQVQLNGLAKGLYIITFEGENFKSVQKLLVK
ncbi:MAG: choice-of-anchor J domain-containing protein [Weeksellaceae bacterium]|nr:choice-of-anchor J domain-containing protein [Weeksellaceae bacterium]